MTQITLYTGGGVSLSPVNAEGRVESAYVRLVADEGKMLKNRDVTAPCVDVTLTDVSNWQEVDEEKAEEEAEEELTAEEIAAILLGET